ncbi:MAG: HesA/MoeB/ThiF family protein [Flavobacteriales bacterium]|nr:HesA/MoeB/ThiF family protein [Flavobacteriales bacterium]
MLICGLNDLNMFERKYHRQLMLPDFTVESQSKLRHSKVLVVGCGGLGSPVILYLAGAGVGTIGLADADIIKEENLHRQIIYREKDIGRKKTAIAMEQGQLLNRECNFLVFDERIENQNVASICGEFDIVVDCSDNFETRFVLDDFCSQQAIPLVYGAIYRYEGQVSVFNYRNGVRYRDFLPSQPEPGTIPDCELGGVLGTLTGAIGCIQANEVIKIITHSGEVLDGVLAIFNIRHMELSKFAIPKLDRDFHHKKQEVITMKQIDKTTMEAWRQQGEDFQLIDVREPYEYEEFNIGGELIPMGEIPNEVSRISRDKKVVIHCKAGVRSAHVIDYLMREHGYQNLYNLRNGILDWQ